MGQDYRTSETLFQGSRTVVRRAVRLADGTPVVTKSLQEHHPSPADLARLAREYEITLAAAGDGVIQVYDLFDRTIVFQDFGARSVAAIKKERALPLSTILRLAVQIADALERVHRLDIVHRDLNPSNLVMNETTGVAKLIDFGIAQVLSRETAQRFEGTAAYVSPEQTGRMNRPVDHRSDLYSMGVTLYELMAGRPPFRSDDELALIHAHIAQTPKPLSEVNPAIPQALSRIVATLLEKHAEDRYQSARGLSRDLARCLEQLEATGEIADLALRGQDIDERLRIPQKLYGREAEVAELEAACTAAVQGEARLLLIGGYSGIGKTSLVREVHRLMTGRNARFAEGKCDQFQRGEPYGALAAALRDAMDELLDQPDEVLDEVGGHMLRSLGGNGGVIVDMVEELEHLIGPQPVPDPLPPAEARNRLQLVMAAFLRGLAAPESPLVLFLDDLQWADLPTLELLQRVAADPQLSHTVIVGAYRDNEIDEVHPLTATIAALKDHERLAEIILGPLREGDVADLVADTVHSAPGHEELAAICMDRTGGNPFFLNRFIEALHTDGELRFDPIAGSWSWDLEAIASRPLEGTVVEFLTGRILRLPVEQRLCVQQAAAIGDRFDLHALAAARQCSPKEALDTLRGAIEAELVLPEADGFWYARSVTAGETNFAWRFAHDRIRQAAHGLLAPAEATRVHLRIGRLLLGRLDEEALGRRLFELVDHLQRARPMLAAREQNRLLDLQLEAARRAMGSAAFGRAHEIFTDAIDGLPDDAWTAAYDRTIALHIEGGRAAWLSQDPESMRVRVDAALAHADNPMDRIGAREVELYAMVGQNRFVEAVELALELLAELDIRFPEDPTDADIGAAIGEVLEGLANADTDALPLADDPRVAAVMRIQNGVMSAAYLARPKLLPLLACSIVMTTLEHGAGRQSPYGFAVVGLVLNAINVFDVGYATSGIALKLLDRWDDRAVRARTEHVVFNQGKYFVDPIRGASDTQLKVFQLAVDTGDLEYAGWALQVLCCKGFYAGVALPELEQRVEQNVSWMAHNGQMPALFCTTPWGQLIASLTGKAEDPSKLVGADYDESELLAQLTEVGFKGAACIVTVTSGVTRYLFGKPEEALAWLDDGADFLEGAAATYHIVWWHQFRALAWLALGRDPEALAPHLAQLEAWCAAGPVNHQHRLDLVKAEMARVDGRTGDAMDHYDRSIKQASEQGFQHEEALANELAGRFHLGRGSETVARAYLREAVWVWRRWGATAKASKLEDEFGDLLVGTNRSRW